MGLFDKLFGKKENAAAEEKSREAEAPTAVPPPASPLDPIPTVPPALQPEASPAAPAPVANPPAIPQPPTPESLPEPEPSAPTADVIPFPSRAAVETSIADSGSTQGSGQVLSMPSPPDAQSGALTPEQMRNDPNFVRVFDQYGQEVFLTREQWQNEILPASLEANRKNPDELYAILINAMNDGLFAEIEPASAQLYAIDTNPLRGACIRAIVLLQLGRVDESESVLNAYTERFGEEGAVLTNLAKVYAAKDDAARAEATLWRAIELDPNLENAVGWYLAVEFERGGEAARQAAMDRVAALPGSWRARLWMAKVALENKNLPRALELYREGLSSFDGIVPADFLYPMSGDLGMAGHLRELIDTTAPLYLPEAHGLMVGNNLVKAYVDLGELDPAAAIVSRLFGLGRPDWRDTLGFWDNTIARLRVASRPQSQQGPLEIGMLEMIGPVWKRAGGPLEAVFGAKSADAPVVTILGGTADFTPPEGPEAMQLADALGRLSRALPLFLAEQLEFHTSAQLRTLLPRVTSGGSGFVLRGGAWTDAETLQAASEAELTPQLVIRAHIDARAADWLLQATVLRAGDGVSLGTVQAACPAGHPELAVLNLARDLAGALAQTGVQTGAPTGIQTGIAPMHPPALYRLPEGPALASYMIRLEQLLAVRSALPVEDEAPSIAGEREILEGNLLLALQNPGSPAVRSLLAATAAAMRRIRPEILPEFTGRIERLMTDQPLGEPLDDIIDDMISD